MIIGSLEGSLGSIGGFCVGASVVIEHQRLSGLGYCFSASLPPFLSQISIAALDGFDRDPKVFAELRRISGIVDERLGKVKGLKVASWKESPLKVVQVEGGDETAVKDVQDFVCWCMAFFGYLFLIDLFSVCKEEIVSGEIGR